VTTRGNTRNDLDQAFDLRQGPRDAAGAPNAVFANINPY
jgi:hypothetical protein